MFISSSLYRLLLYGICCCLKDKYKEADEAMELATVIDDCNAIAWTIRGSFIWAVDISC